MRSQLRALLSGRHEALLAQFVAFVPPSVRAILAPGLAPGAGAAAAAAAAVDDDDDDELMASSARLSLQCPLSRVRIGVPCGRQLRARRRPHPPSTRPPARPPARRRGPRRRPPPPPRPPPLRSHLECFDLISYLELARVARPAKWKCPLCQRAATPDKLRVDAWLAWVLQTAPPDATDAGRADGTISQAAQPRRASASAAAPAPESIDVDGDVPPPSPSRTGETRRTRSASPTPIESMRSFRPFCDHESVKKSQIEILRRAPVGTNTPHHGRTARTHPPGGYTLLPAADAASRRCSCLAPVWAHSDTSSAKTPAVSTSSSEKG